MLGTGTPNPDPQRSGPSVAIVVKDTAYLFDCGVGVVRRAVEGYQKGISGLKPEKLSKCFITHLHSDHTLGLADLILTPWVLERDKPLELIGPKGLKEMVHHLKAAYILDINERIQGHEGNEIGQQVHIKEIENDGIIYQDEQIKVEAISVIHGSFDGVYGYKIITDDGIIVLSGDSNPCINLVEKASGCDVLIHEVYYADGLKQREAYWQKYHSSVHTSSKELGIIANQIKPKTLILYHQLYMFDINTYSDDLFEQMKKIEHIIVEDIKDNFDGNIICANDLDIFNL